MLRFSNCDRDEWKIFASLISLFSPNIMDNSCTKNAIKWKFKFRKNWKKYLLLSEKIWKLSTLEIFVCYFTFHWFVSHTCETFSEINLWKLKISKWKSFFSFIKLRCLTFFAKCADLIIVNNISKVWSGMQLMRLENSLHHDIFRQGKKQFRPWLKRNFLSSQVLMLIFSLYQKL